MADTEYKPNRFLEQAVQDQDTDIVKLALRQIISAYPDFKSRAIYNAIEYAETHGIKVYEDTFREDLEIIMDRSKWNDDYFAEAMVNLQYNFRPERLEHVKEVGKYLYAKPEQSKAERGKKEGEPSRPKAKRIVRIQRIVIAGVILIVLTVLIINVIK